MLEVRMLIMWCVPFYRLTPVCLNFLNVSFSCEADAMMIRMALILLCTVELILNMCDCMSIAMKVYLFLLVVFNLSHIS